MMDTSIKQISNPDSADRIIEDLSAGPRASYVKWFIYGLVALVIIGLIFYAKQLQQGLGVTAMRDYTTWGIYISNFVFFVAISLVGSLISAVLKLSGAHWQTPLTRISEMIAVSAIILASIVIIIDMGRPDRFLNVIFHARLQSPITWDVIVIATYLVISLLLLYLPLIPDLALLRNKWENRSDWRKRLYTRLALNWEGTKEQKKILTRSIKVLSIIIIPVAFGIHTVTSWLFATTLRPGWDSNNFGPYFVSGAFMVGAGAVITAMFFYRKSRNLEQYITDDHFDKMGKLLLLLSFVYLYFNVNEYFVPAYKMKALESGHLYDVLYGEFALMFWTVQIVGMIIPIIVLFFKKGRKPRPMLIVSLLVIVGAWFKRFLIVVPTLSHPYIPTDRLPHNWLHYFPTVEEWFITTGTLAAAILIVIFLARIFPVIPIVETLDMRKVIRKSTLPEIGTTEQTVS